MDAKRKKKKPYISLRINILFFLIFIIFAGLILQLGVVQILHGEEYQREIDKTIEDTAKISVPRGKFYDRNHKVLIDNKVMYAITYTPPKRVQPEDKLELAEKLVSYMSVSKKDIKRITENNLREYVYLKNTEEIMERLSEKDLEEDNSKQYKIALEKVTDEEIDSISDDEKKIIAIKRELDKAYALTPQIIKNDKVSAEEYARIAENLSELPGISVSTDWERENKYGNLLSSIFGSITTQEQGIPAEGEEEYLLTGYNRNDRVGRSGLEDFYEDVLRGRKEEVKYTTTKDGEVIDSEVVVPGERGKDLVLSIDIEYQKEVDKIVRSELKKIKETGSHQFLEDALAVVMNPKTGEILALSGQHYNKEKNEYEDAPYKALYDVHEPGSTIKGATVLTGFNEGVIAPGQVFFDSPIKMKDTKPMSSLSKTIGSTDDIKALERSSNVYMYYIALRLMGDNRYPFPTNGIPPFNKEGLQVMRNNFGQFGLGSSTGIDFPSESTGQKSDPDNPANILFNAIGQFDTYTTLQMAQYVSTIANDGVRVKPKLVNEIRYPSSTDELGGVYRHNDVEILNTIEVDDEAIKRVQTGFQRVFNSPSGTGYRYWNGKSYKPAGKTGTAETSVYENGNRYSVINLSLVGYAPYDDPEVAFAVLVPNLSSSSAANGINHQIGTKIMDAYFERNIDKKGKDEDEDE